MKRLGVVDYRLGNLPSVTKALARSGAEAVLITHPAEFEQPLDAIVLPGVGHFGTGARNLHEMGYVEPLRSWAASGKPFLGICVGLQLMFATSEEDPDARGLGIVDGTVRRLKPDGDLKVPHMGWNTLEVRDGVRVLSAVEPGERVYFVHSYCVDPPYRAVAATTEYGQRFCSAIESRNLVGVQFHPEKSADVGRKVLEAFVRGI